MGMSPDPHGDDPTGGWETGRKNAMARQEDTESEASTDRPDSDDFDAKAREDDVRKTNAWIKGGEKTD